MAKNFGSIAFTPGVQEEQRRHGSLAQYRRMVERGPDTNLVGMAEREFIESRDGMYMASVSETGWPYAQFRGGPAGFLQVLDERTIGFADFRGNRQYVSVGNLKHDSRVALFLMDYPSRSRLKILGRAEIVEGPEAAALSRKLTVPGYNGQVERVILIRLEVFDWNCQQHITPRYTAEEVAEAVEPLRQRMRELEAELVELRGKRQGA